VNIGCLLDCASRNAGGLFESVRRIAQSFPQTQGTTMVFSLEDEHAKEDAGHWQPLKLHLFERKWFPQWGYAPQLSEALLDANIEMLMTHGLWKYSSLASLRWHRRTRRPYIIHAHGMLDPWAVQNSKWRKRVAAMLYESVHLRGAACLRALCESEARAMRAYGLRNPICVIPNGIDLPDLGSIPNSEFQFPNVDGRKILLYLGRLHPKKNLVALLHAWAAVQRDNKGAKEWVLAIAGWDQNGYEAELHQQCSDLGLSFSLPSPPRPGRGTEGEVSSSDHSSFAIRHSVAFLGPLFGEAKAAAYRNATAFVLPSLSEGLPMVVLEAWAFAKPVLMTPECNLPEGFQANAALRIGTDAPSIATGLRELMAMSDAQRIDMGAQGRALVSKKFLWPRIGEEMRSVCEWVMNGGTAPASVRCD